MLRVLTYHLVLPSNPVNPFSWVAATGRRRYHVPTSDGYGLQSYAFLAGWPRGWAVFFANIASWSAADDDLTDFYHLSYLLTKVSDLAYQFLLSHGS